MKKTIAVFLVFSLFWLSASLYAEKKGAEIVIDEMNGQQITGELITVKENSILLMEKKSGADVSVQVQNIRKVIIVKKSKALLGLGLGFLVGFAIPVAYSVAEGSIESGMALGAGAIIFGPIGAVLGGLLGEASGTDEQIQFEDKSDSEIKEILEKLRKKARVPDFQ